MEWWFYTLLVGWCMSSVCTVINCVHFEQFQHAYKMHSTCAGQAECLQIGCCCFSFRWFNSFLLFQVAVARYLGISENRFRQIDRRQSSTSDMRAVLRIVANRYGAASMRSFLLDCNRQLCWTHVQLLWSDVSAAELIRMCACELSKN